MNREEYLHSKFGKQQPFRVPEGYFDDFASQLLQQLPEREEREATVVAMRPQWHWRPVAAVAAAACLGVLLFNVGTSFFHRGQQSSADYAAVPAVQVATAGSDFDQMADYAMIDVGDMYAYVSDY